MQGQPRRGLVEQEQREAILGQHELFFLKTSQNPLDVVRVNAPIGVLHLADHIDEGVQSHVQELRHGDEGAIVVEQVRVYAVG